MDFSNRISFLIAIVGLCTSIVVGQDHPTTRTVPSDEKKLAVRLIATKDSAERQAILTNSKLLLNAKLVEELGAEGNRLDGKVPSTEILDIFTLALHIAEQVGNKDLVAKALRDVGNSLLAQGKSAEATESYQRGLTISQEIGNVEMTARLLGSLANVFFGKDDDKALDFIERSNIAAEQIDAKIIIAANLGRVGNFHAGKGDLVNALVFQQRSLAINEQLNDVEGASRARVNIGIIQTKQGDYTRAQESLENGLAYFNLKGDKDRAGMTLYNLGNVLLEKGDFAQAMVCFSKSLKNFEDISANGGIEGVSTNIANLYIAQGNYELARTYLDRASLIADKTGKAIPQYALGSYGDSYKGQGRFDKANEFYEKLLALKESSGNKDSIAETLINIGNTYLLVPDAQKAEQYFTRALRLSEETGNQVWLLRAAIGIAATRLARQDFESALASATLAARHYDNLRGARGYWEMYTVLGSAHLGLGNKKEARVNFDKAINTIEEQRYRVAGGTSERQGFWGNKIDPYHLIVELLSSQGSISEAFKYVEMAKARTLVETIGTGKVAIDFSMTPEERTKERAFRNEMVSLVSQLDKENRAVNPDLAIVDNLEKRLVRKRLELSDFHVQLYSVHPELELQRGELRPISLEESAELIPDEKRAIAEFVVARERTFLVIITKDVAKRSLRKVFAIDVKEKTLSATVESYRSKVAVGDLDFQKASHELYDLLLKPVEEELTGKTNIIIVPDGPLWNLPFQALMDEKGKYLVEKAAVSYAPSLTALREMRKRAKSRKHSGEADLLAFGNPTIAAATRERVQRVFMSEKLEPIPEAERLVNSLAKMYGSHRSRVFTGANAREETAKTESPKYRIVQFATHGILNNASPMYSHLVMAHNDKNPNEDGLLEAWELKDMDLKADMVILSACDTARGKISNGEGVIGMTWASFIAGAPTTVATQWKVESTSTTELMLEFHRQLLAKKRVSKAEALRRASLKIMKDPRFRHPSYWAGFVMVGDAS